MNWKTAAIAALISVGAFSPALATSGKHCTVAPGAKWITAEQAAAKARALGYDRIREIERDDGCWEVKARDAKGERFEIYLHPVTGEVHKIERD